MLQAFQKNIRPLGLSSHGFDLQDRGATLFEMWVTLCQWHNVTSQDTWFCITTAVGTQKSPTSSIATADCCDLLCYAAGLPSVIWVFSYLV